MSQIASKNLYELLGNDLELDPNREPEPPTKVIDKPVQRTGKRNPAAEGPAKDAPRPAAAAARGGRTDAAGAQKPREDRPRREPRGDGARSERGRGRGRGGRGDGARGARPVRDDRHSHTGIGEHEKQAGHGWGFQEGTSEWNDEKAGADLAAAEVKNDDSADPAAATGPDGVNAAPEVEEDNTKSYEQYLADLAEKRQALAGDSLAIRKPNEGSSQKFPEGKPVERVHEEYFAGAGGKQHRAKETKTKNSLALDGQYYAAPDTGDRGRGGARGGRGEGRGGRGRGEGRGRGGRGRGEGRGGAPSGARTEQRGGPRGGAINTKDESAFPSLGA